MEENTGVKTLHTPSAWDSSLSGTPKACKIWLTLESISSIAFTLRLVRVGDSDWLAASAGASSSLSSSGSKSSSYSSVKYQINTTRVQAKQKVYLFSAQKNLNWQKIVVILYYLLTLQSTEDLPSSFWSSSSFPSSFSASPPPSRSS